MHEQFISDVEGFDLDDTLFMRERVARWGGAIKGRLAGHSFPKYNLQTLPSMDHTPVDRPFKGKGEQISFNYHSKRQVLPGVVEKLRSKVDQGKTLIGITGRAATLDWYDMTLEQIDRARIPISKILLTPEGISTAVSKAHGILTNNVSAFYDDNLRTQIYLSDLFPERKIRWIRHQVTDIPLREEEIERRPNLVIIPLKFWIG